MFQLQNLLAAYSGSSNGSSSSGSDIGTIISGVLVTYGSLIVIVLIFLAVRWFVEFLIPFYIRSMKNSQKEMADQIYKQVKISTDICRVEEERLKIEKERLEIEKEKLMILRTRNLPTLNHFDDRDER